MKQKLSAKNKAFWRLSKSEKRVAIAKDIIKQISKGKIKPKEGLYIHIKNKKKINNEDIPLDSVFSNNTCQACALGSCFISLVNLGDNLRLSDIEGSESAFYRSWSIEALQDDYNWRKYLRRAFTPRQLSLIESAFEKRGITDEKDTLTFWNVNDVTSKAKEFGRTYKKDNERLIGICKNIIANKGTFKP